MKEPRQFAVNGCSLCGLPFLLLLLGISQCNTGAPCEGTDETTSGNFDGVVYDPMVGGQLYGNSNELCIHSEGEVFYTSGLEVIQTVITVEHVGAQELYVIALAAFQEPVLYGGGLELVVATASAERSARTGEPISLDGVNAVGYIWQDGFFMEQAPDRITDSGSITFSMATVGSGGPVAATFEGTLIPYAASEPSTLRVPPFSGSHVRASPTSKGIQ